MLAKASVFPATAFINTKDANGPRCLVRHNDTCMSVIHLKQLNVAMQTKYVPKVCLRKRIIRQRYISSPSQHAFDETFAHKQHEDTGLFLRLPSKNSNPERVPTTTAVSWSRICFNVLQRKTPLLLYQNKSWVTKLVIATCPISERVNRKAEVEVFTHG